MVVVGETYGLVRFQRGDGGHILVQMKSKVSCVLLATEILRGFNAFLTTFGSSGRGDSPGIQRLSENMAGALLRDRT